MHRLVNLLWILFLLNSGVRLVDELLRLGGSDAVLHLHHMTLVAALLAALPLYALLAVDRRLPKGRVVFLTLILAWSAAGMWPLSALVPAGMTGVTGALIQALSALAVVAACRRTGGRGIWFSPETLPPPVFSLHSSLRFIAANVLLLPPAALFLVVGGIGGSLEQETGGFLRLGLDGIYMTEKRFQRGRQSVHLTGMIHIGSQAYYRELAASVPPGRTIVLLEGVTDHGSLLSGGLDHSRLAGLVGLSSQQELSFSGRRIEEEALVASALSAEVPLSVHLFRADGDTADFAPLTVDFLNMLGHLIKGSDSIEEAFRTYQEWSRDHLTDEVVKTISEDILDSRNRVLVHHLKAALAAYDTIIVPWGAMHMPHFQDWLRQRGFALHGSMERRAIAFADLDAKGLPGL